MNTQPLTTMSYGTLGAGLLHKEGVLSKAKRAYIVVALGVIFILSIALNVVQYVDQHRLGYVSNIKVNSIPAPDSITWNGRTYWTDGERNSVSADLRWLGVGKAANKNINVFEVIGVNPRTEVDYILGNRLVTARTKQ